MTFKVMMSNYYPYNSPKFDTREKQLEYDLRITKERLDALSENPGVFAVVLGIEKKRVTICTGPQMVDLKEPPAMEGLEPGAVVRLRAGDPPGILAVCHEPPIVGNVVSAKQVLDKYRVEITHQGQSRVVLVPSTIEVKSGDRLVLDFTSNVVVKNIGQGDKSKAFSTDTGITWDDIGGLEEAKKLLIEAIEEPIKLKDLYARYGRRPVRGVLLYGPPGTGKSLLGKACATALATIHGASARSGGFLYVKGPEMLNMFVGNSESNIRSLFSAAREHHEREGYPAIVFIDEADALMGKRGAGRFEGMERTIVPQFLAEMDGLEDSGAMVLLATNRADTLDPAVVRDGRVDRKIFIRRPTQSESEHIFRLHLKRVPCDKGVTHKELATAGASALFDDKNALYLIRCKDGKDQRFGIRELASGALIASLADKASQKALRRERDGGQPFGGVTCDDVQNVIQETLKEQVSLDHNSDLSSFIEDNKLEVTKVERIS